MSEWEDVGSLLEDLKKIMIILLGIIADGVLFYVFSFVANTTAGFGDYILQTLNETGFTIPASANYVAPIESLASSALLTLRTPEELYDLLALIGTILAVVGIVVVLLKRYDGLSV